MTQNVAYGPHNITATGGVAPYTFSTVPADLPPAVILTGAGVLSGTPTTPGTYDFTITATTRTDAPAAAPTPFWCASRRR